MGQIYRSDSLRLAGAGSDSSTKQGYMLYSAAWVNGTTYTKGVTVTLTVNGVPGVYVCVVGSTVANPASSDDWSRMAGTASAVDGISANEGNITYNRVVDVTTSPFVVQAYGELSWILRIARNTTIDVSNLVSDLYNANPAAVVRLEISASSAITVALTGAENYWLEDGSNSADAPSFSVDAEQPLTIIEISRVTNPSAPGVLVRQLCPVQHESAIPALGEPGASGFFMTINGAEQMGPGSTLAATGLYYCSVNDGGSLIQANGIYPDGGTWELRGHTDASGTAEHSASLWTRIDNVSTTLRGTGKICSLVRNLSYADEAGSRVDCELLIHDVWHPFTASPTDSTWWGQEIYAAAIAGQLGSVAAYVAPEMNESVEMVSKNPPVSMEYHNSVVHEVRQLREQLEKAYQEQRALVGEKEKLSSDVVRLKTEIDSRISASEAMRKSCQRWVEKYFRLDDRLVCTQRTLRSTVMALKLTAVAAAAIVIVSVAYIAQFLN